MGIGGFCGAIAGAISASVIGAILEATGSYFIVFAIASSAYMIAWLIINLMIPEIKPLNIR